MEEFGFDAVIAGYTSPTSLQFVQTATGDDLLITSQQDGTITVWLITSTGVGEDKDFSAEEVYSTEIVNTILNHNDDGSLATGITNRQVTGLLAEYNAATGEIEVYVSSSDPRIGGGGEAQVDNKPIDTNSGVLSKLTFDVPVNVTDDTWSVDKIDLLRGIPRSEENHSVNGMDFTPEGNLLISVGGFTNAGAPSQNLVYTPEYYLSGAILEVDVNAIEALPTQTDGEGQDYKYDLPTLGIERGSRDEINGETVDGVGFSKNADNPFGGNDGYNQAYLEPNGPVEIFATGLRNAYDVEVYVLKPGDIGYVEGEQNFRVYTWDNGANNGWGDPSVDANGVPITSTNGDEADNVPVVENNNPVSPGAQDQLHLIEKGGYYGSPNASRANPDARLYLKPEIEIEIEDVLDAEDNVIGQTGLDGFAVPAPEFVGPNGELVTLRDYLPPELNGDPLNGYTVTALEGFYLKPQTGGNSPDDALVLNNGSTNGIVIFNYDPAIHPVELEAFDGDLFATGFDEQILRVEFSADGATALNRAELEANIPWQDSQGSNPLDVTVGPGGSIWVAAHGGNNIFAFVPGGVPVEETNNDDSDNLIDNLDPFQLDPNNGLSINSRVDVGEVFEFTMENEVGAPNGLSGFVLGFTGHQVNYNTEFFTNASGVVAGGVLDGGIAGKLQIEFDAVGTGDARGPVAEGQGNDLTYALQAGLNFEDASQKILIESVMTNAWSGADAQAGQEQGIYFGTGTQFDFAQFNFAINDAGEPVVIVTIELNDTIAFQQEYAAPGLDDGVADTDMVMRVVVDRDAGTVTPVWEYVSNAGVQTGTAGALSLDLLAPGEGNSLLDALAGANSDGYFAREAPADGEQGAILLGDLVGEFGAPVGLAVGINGRVDTLGTDPAGSSFAPEFDNLLITASDSNGDFAPNAENEIAGSVEIGETLLVNVADLLLNDSDFLDATLTITAVAPSGGGSAELVNGGTQVAYTPAGLGDDGFTYTVSNGSLTAEAMADVVVTPPAGEGIVLYRVNAGGATIDAVDGGPAWIGDTTPEGSGFLSGVTTGVFSNGLTNAEDEMDLNALDGTVPWQVFIQERGDGGTAAPNLEYTFGVTQGQTYEVTLYFVENWHNIFTSPVNRVFDVQVNGVVPPQFDDIHPLQEAADLVGTALPSGGLSDAEKQPYLGTAFSKTYQLTADTADLVISFLNGTQNPKVNAIEIKALGVVVPDPIISIGDVSVIEGGDLVFDINRDGDDSEAIEVAYEIVPDSAVEGTDYTVPGETPDGNGVITGTATIAGSSSDQSVTVTSIDNMIADGTRSFTVNLTGIVLGDAVIGDGEATGTILDNDLVPGTVVAAINAGGPAITIDGIAFDSDTAAVNHPTLDLTNATAGGGGTGNNTNANGADDTFVNADGTPFTGDTTLFETERWTNDFGYNFPLPNGDYTVDLYLAETFVGIGDSMAGIGGRLFDISLEGNVVADDVDLFDEGNGMVGDAAGQPLVPIIKTFNVTVADGQLDLDFLASVDNAKIGAIVVKVAEDDGLPAQVSVEAALDAVEDGDIGVTTLEFPVSFDKTPNDPVTVEYSVDVNGVMTDGLTLDLGTTGASISVDVTNDDLANGDDAVTVTLTGITVGGDGAVLGAVVSASAAVTEDEFSSTPTDIDGDGTLNTDDPFAYDVSNGDAKVLVAGGEFIQNFDADTTNPFSAEAGFSGIIVNPAFDPAGASAADPYGDRTTEDHFSVANGVASVTSSNEDKFGDGNTGGNNTIKDNYQSAADVTGVDTFEVAARVANPFTEAVPGAFASFGITLGAGGVDDYIKFVLGGANLNAEGVGGPRIQMAQEGSLTGAKEANLNINTLVPAVVVTDIEAIEFTLAVDTTVTDLAGATVAGTVTATAVLLGAADAVLATVTLPVRGIAPDGSLAAAINGENPLTGGDGGIAYGLSITDYNGGANPNAVPSFTAEFDYLRLTATDDVPEITLSIADAAAVTETGDLGDTTVTFDITADTAFSGDVEITADIDTGAGPVAVTQTVTLTDGAGTVSVLVANDDVANGAEAVSVTLTGSSTAGFVIDDTLNAGTGSVTEDDFVAPYDEATEGDLSDDNLAPSDIKLGLGDNSVTGAQQGFPEDRDFFTVTIEDGQVLNEVILTNWTGGTDDPGFIGFMAGDQFTADPTTLENDPGANPAELGVLGGYVYGESDLGTDLLAQMNALGFVGFSQPLEAGEYTFWLNQNGGSSAATLNFVTSQVSTLAIGDAPEIVEGGDDGTSSLVFPVTMTPAVEGDVELSITVDDGTGPVASTATVTFDAAGNGALTVDIANDDADTGTTSVSVTLDGTSSAQFVVDSMAATASGDITEDDTVDPTDIDGDGTLNTDDPFAYDSANGDLNVLERGGVIAQEFDTDTTNPFSAEAGFSGIIVNPAFDPAGASAADPYGDRTTEDHFSVANGVASVTSSNEDLFGNTGTGGNNTIKDNYQSAADVTGVDTFEVAARVANPFMDAAPGAFASYGLTLGAGGVSDYVKFVLGGSNVNADGVGGPRIQIAQEGSLTGAKEENLNLNTLDPAVDITDVVAIEFTLAVDTTVTDLVGVEVAGTVTATAVLLGAADAVLATVTLPARGIAPNGSLAAAINGENPLTGGDGGIAYGLSITDFGNGAPEFTADWDYLRLISNDDGAAPTAVIAPIAAIEDSMSPITVEVTYTDNVEVDGTSVDVTDLALSGPGLAVPIAADDVVFVPGTGLATYTFNPPAEGWSNGAFTVDLVAGAVADTSGNLSEAASAGFTVAEPIMVSVAADPSTVVEAEGAQATFTVSLSYAPGMGETVTANYTIGDVADTALLDEDYSAMVMGSVVFAEGETEKTITVDLINDAVTEDAEVFTVALTSADLDGTALPVATASAAVTIEAESEQGGTTDDDVIDVVGTDEVVDLSDGGDDTVAGTSAELDELSIVGFAEGDEIVVEGSSTAQIVRVEEGSVLLGVDVDGDSVEDIEIVLEDVPPLVPDRPYLVEDFTVTTDETGNTSTITLDPLPFIPPVIALSTPVTTELAEATEDVAVLQITLSEAAAEDITISYSAVGTATQGDDFFIGPVGSVTIAAGQLSAPLFVEVLNDTAFEGPESFTLSLTDATYGDTAIDISSAIDTTTAIAYTLTDDDADVPPPGDPVSLEAEDFTGLGNSAFFEQGAFAASNFALIRLNTGQTGTVETELPDGVTAGSYRIVIHYFDENDGQISATVGVDGETVAGWTFDNDGPSAAATADNLRSVTFNDILLQDDSVFSITSTQAQLEFARIDRVEFIRLGDLPENQPPVGVIEDAVYAEGEDVAITFDFADPEEAGTITYEATLADGAPLPDWLILGETGLTGTPPPEAAGSVLELLVTATDADGFSTSVPFSITLTDDTGPLPAITVTPPETQADAIIVDVVYTDNSEIDAFSIDVGDVVLTGPTPVLAATSVVFDPETNTATYTFDAPVEGWAFGAYEASIPAEAVSDILGNPSQDALPAPFDIGAPIDGNATFTANLGGTSINTDSTFGNTSMVITNQSTNGVTIESVVFDLSTTAIPEVVFDPNDGSPAGDAANKSFTLGSAVGVDAPAVTYGDPLGAGFLTMTLDFSAVAQAFDNGDSIAFGMDVDPLSAYSPLGGGATSGLELSGGTFTVTYSDGTTATGVIAPAAVGTSGGIAVANTANAATAVAPSVFIADAGMLPVTEPTLTNEALQSVTIDAGIENAGQTVRLFVLDTAFYTIDSTEGPDLQGNSVNAGPQIIEAVIGVDGTVVVDVTLTRTDHPSTEDDLNLGINYVSAAIVQPDGSAGPLSNVLTVEFDPNAIIGDDDLAPNGDLDGDEIANAVDPDVDGDLIDNVDDAFAYDAENGVLIAEDAPLTLTFDVDGTAYQNGFTGLLQSTTPGFDEDTGTATVADGKLTVVANNGDTGGPNNPSDDFQLGVKNASFTVDARIDNPFQTTAAANFDQLGIHVGVDSADFVKLVFGFTAGVVEFSSQTADVEAKATGGNQPLPAGVTLADFAYADLTLDVTSLSDTSAVITSTISFFAADGTLLAGDVNYGSLPITGALATALADEAVGVGAGFTQTQFGGADAPFNAVIDTFTVTAKTPPVIGEDVVQILSDIETTATYTGGEVGEAIITITPGDGIQQSNFGPNSFQVTNTGDKAIAAVFIDVRGAIYPDSIFDPDGLGGDSVAKAWAVNTDGGTGAFVPNTGADGNGYFLPGEAPLAGADPSNGGYRGAIVQFNDFGNGETVGFSGDMDPNSIAGLAKSDVDSGAILGWDVGGVSGAELIGSTVYVLFDDGSISASQLHGDGSQSGSQAKISEVAVPKTATLTVNTDVPGEYGDVAPEVIVSGNAGDTVRVILTKGFNPVTNAAVADLVANRLADDEFEANNAFEFQFADVDIPVGGSIDISDQFTYSAAFGFDGDTTSPIGFTAAVIDGDGFAEGPVADPIYLVSNGVPVDDSPSLDGAYLGENGRVKVQFEDLGETPGADWSFFDGADEEGNQSGFQGSGYYEWNDGGYAANGDVLDTTGINAPQGLLSYTFVIPEGEEGDYVLRLRSSRDSGTPGDARNDVWVRIDDDAEALLTNSTNAVSDSGFIKLFGASNGNWGFAQQIDSVSDAEPNFVAEFALTAGTHTITFAGRSDGYHLDFFELYSGSTPPLNAPNSEFVAGGPTEPTVFDPVEDFEVEIGAGISFTLPANTFQDIDGDVLTLTADVPAGVLFDPVTGTFSGEPTAGIGAYPITVTATDPDGNFALDTFIISVVEEITGPPLVFNDPAEMTLDGTNGSVLELAHTSAYEFEAGTVAFTFNADNTSGGQGLFTKDAKNFQGGGNHFLATLNGDELSVRLQDGSTSETLSFDGIQPGVDYDVAVRFGPNGASLWVNGSQVDTSDIVTDWRENVEFIQWGARGWGSPTGEPGFDAVFEGTLSNKQIYAGELTDGQIIALSNGGPANSAPVAADDVFTTTEDVAVDGNVLDANGGPADSDPDNGPLPLAVTPDSFSTANGGTVTISANGDFTYTPASGFTGQDTFSYTVSDGTDTDTAAVTVTVEADDPVNTAPTVIAEVPDTTIVEGGTVSFDLNDVFDDADGDTLSFTASGLPAGVGQPDANGVLSGTPTETGTFTVTVTADDGTDTVSDTFTLVIEPDEVGNQAPFVASEIADQMLIEGENLAINLNAAFGDPDGDMLTFTAAGLPAGLGQPDTNGLLSGTPTATGTFTVIVTASDGEFSVQDTFELTVDPDTPVNTAPFVVDPIDDVTITEGAGVNIDLNSAFDDAEGDNLTYVVSGLPAGIPQPGLNGILAGTPAETGTFFVTVTASDGEFSETDTFALTIEDDNPGGPSLVFNDPSASVFDGSTGSAIELPHQSAYEIDTGTIAFSFNPDNTSGQQGLFTKDAKNFQGGGNHMLVYLKGDDLLVRVQNGTDSEILRFGGIQAGTFYDVAVTFGPGGATLWVDGNQVDSDSIVTNWSDNVEFIQWGARGWGSQTGEAGFDAVFEGVIANKQIYDGELSAGQIASLAAGGASAPASFSAQLAPSSFSLTAPPPAEEEIEDAGVSTAQTSIAAARSIAPDAGTMVFDGTAATVVELSHRPEYELDQGIVAFSFNAADTDGSQGLFSKDAKFFDGGGNHLLVSLEGTTLTVRLQDGSSSEFLTYEGVRAGVNYDVAVTFGPDGAQLSVNGVEVDNSLLMVDLSQNTEYVQWGARGEDSQTGEAGFDSPFEGSISNAEIAPVELEPSVSTQQMASMVKVSLEAEGPVPFQSLESAGTMTDEDSAVMEQSSMQVSMQRASINDALQTAFDGDPDTAAQETGVSTLVDDDGLI